MTAGNGASNGNGRDHNGRFAAGNPGGPGRRPGDLAAWKAALGRAITPRRLEKVLRALVRQAEEGDVAAARAILPLLVPSADKRQADELEERIRDLEAKLL